MKTTTSTSLPHGTLAPPAALVKSVTGLAKSEAGILVTRDAIRAAVTAFRVRLVRTHPSATLADLARQFDSRVPPARAEYRVNQTYMTLDNMLRTVGGKKGKKKADRVAQAVARAERAERTIMAIVNQVGVPVPLLSVALLALGYTPVEQEKLIGISGALVDVGLSGYMLAVRTGPMAGVAAGKVLAAATVAARPASQVPTDATLAAGGHAEPTAPAAPPAAGKSVPQAQSAPLSKRSRRNPAASL